VGSRFPLRLSPTHDTLTAPPPPPPSGAVQYPPTHVFGDAQFDGEHTADGAVQYPPTHVFGDAQFDGEHRVVTGGITGGGTGVAVMVIGTPPTVTICHALLTVSIG